MSTQMQDLITYSITDAALAELRSKYIGLRVVGIDDAEGYAQCKEARAIVRDTRLGVEERRKELKSESLAFGKAVDAEAKRITAKIEEVESHLVTQLKIVDDEKKRREEEAMRLAKERIETRQKAFADLGLLLTYDEAATLSEADYVAELYDATVQFQESEKVREADRQRVSELEAANAEAERLLREQEALNAKIQAEIDELRRQAAVKALAESVEKVAETAFLPQCRERTDPLEEIKTQFPTLELAWNEIARLLKLLVAADGREGF